MFPSSLDAVIEGSNLAKEFCSITLAMPSFCSFSIVLTMVKVDFYVTTFSALVDPNLVVHVLLPVPGTVRIVPRPRHTLSLSLPSSSFPDMSTIPVSPIATKGGPLNPAVDACFTCTPPFQHPREWIPDPNGPRNRALVLCFDGIGDLFDQDVSRSPNRSYLASRLELNAVPTELQRHAIPGNVEERQSYEAARLSSGDVPSPRVNSRSHPLLSARNRDVSK